MTFHPLILDYEKAIFSLFNKKLENYFISKNQVQMIHDVYIDKNTKEVLTDDVFSYVYNLCSINTTKSKCSRCKYNEECKIYSKRRVNDGILL